MRLTISSLTFVLFLVFFSFEYSSADSSLVLDSSHKFNVGQEIADHRNDEPECDSDVIVISQGESPVKKRPSDFGRLFLSPEKLRKKISARSAIVMDAQSGEVLYSHFPDLPGQPASTIKVLTGLISLDSLNDHDLVKVSRKASRMPRSKIYLQQGKEYPANHLINAVLLASANDASVALAERIAGSEEVFAKLMTAKAKNLGAQNTVCKSSSGLTKKGQKSTARDLAVIFNKAMDNDLFAGKMSKKKIQSDGGNTVYSHNKALWRIDGTIGGKTGYTSAARQTYVGKFKRDGVELVVAFLGSETMWSDTRKLVEYGFAKKTEILAKQQPGYFPSASSVVTLGRSSAKDNIVISTLR